MKYSLRALMLATIIVPPLIAATWSFPAAGVVFVWCAISVWSIAESVECWRRMTPPAPAPGQEGKADR